jgi:lipopolysaccharide transport system ATP-binding protein
MSQPAISIQNLSKCYELGTIGRHTLVDECQYWWHKIRGRNPRQHMAKLGPTAAENRTAAAEQDGKQEFWALQDVSFEVQQGEVIGIIGRNGAGKSTLLKILSRITEPTSGEITIDGRVGSLLEVGTGFHPELTGRENIYMNGTILGMKRAEIARKFDEIVAFSEIEKFLDTPVKRYSSGMYVRLAFAVAAHLEPEILIVDEVLAVGDASFQKKCLGKMGQVAKDGRTILFVSHNMAAVSALCSSVLVLKDGRLDYGPVPTENAVEHYLRQVGQIAVTRLSDRKDRKGAGQIRITGLALAGADGGKREVAICGESLEFQIAYEAANDSDLTDITAAISITSQTGMFITMLCNEIASGTFARIPRQGCLNCRLEKLPLSPGLYTLNLIVRRKDVVQDWIQEAALLMVEAGDFFGTGRIPPASHGGIFFEQAWCAQEAGRAVP